MYIPWFHNKREEILKQPFPEEWRTYLATNIAQYALLTDSERVKLEGDLRIFMAEKYWEGANEFEVNDEVKVTVSALACLLVIGFDHEYYPNVESIIVYPAAYQAPASAIPMGQGVILGGNEGRLGEAHGSPNGPIIISWADVLEGGRNAQDGRNVVLHEFAHKLDFRSGDGDGVPKLETQEQYDRWAEVMSREFAELVDDADHHRHSLLNSYGATNPAEFFAVATEGFFEKPVKMKQEHVELYEVLEGFYRMDWGGRVKDSSNRAVG